MESVEDTFPGFDERHDMIHLKVVEARTEEENGRSLNDNHKEVGEYVKGRFQNPACSVSHVGEISCHDYSKEGFTQAEILRLGPYF